MKTQVNRTVPPSKLPDLFSSTRRLPEKGPTEARTPLILVAGQLLCAQCQYPCVPIAYLPHTLEILRTEWKATRHTATWETIILRNPCKGV